MTPEEIIRRAKDAHNARFSWPWNGGPEPKARVFHIVLTATQVLELVEYVRIKTEHDLVNKGWRLR